MMTLRIYDILNKELKYNMLKQLSKSKLAFVRQKSDFLLGLAAMYKEGEHIMTWGRITNNEVSE